jgi:hypothetical protein
MSKKRVITLLRIALTILSRTEAHTYYDIQQDTSHLHLKIRLNTFTRIQTTIVKPRCPVSKFTPYFSSAQSFVMIHILDWQTDYVGKRYWISFLEVIKLAKRLKA